MPLDVTAGMEPGKHPLKRSLEFRIYHKVLQVSDGMSRQPSHVLFLPKADCAGLPAGNVNGGDLLIGKADVDLSPLLYTGFEELNGWYHVVDFKGEGQGEIKLQITPSKPFPKKCAVIACSRNAHANRVLRCAVVSVCIRVLTGGRFMERNWCSRKERTRPSLSAGLSCHRARPCT